LEEDQDEEEKIISPRLLAPQGSKEKRLFLLSPAR